MFKIKSFYDSHLHFVGIGLNALEYVDLSDCDSYQNIRDVLSKNLDRNIIIARGWHQENFIEKETFTKELLNTVSSDIPIVCIRTCGHVLVCNDAMMDMANIESITPQVEGGTFDCSTGEFTENALELIYKHLPKPTKERIKEYMKAANKILLSNGVTACGSDDFSTLPVDYEIIIDAYKEAYEEGLIDVRIYQQVNIPDYDTLYQFIEKGYHTLVFGKFKMGPLKLLADGSLGGRTALLNAPYSDDPNNYGVSTFTQKELNQLVLLADTNGIDVAIHAIGDGCVDMVLDAIENSSKETNNIGRHSIIHAQLANSSQIERMKLLGVGAQTQPIFLNSDIPIIENRLGNRSKESYLFNTMFQKGICTTISTDCPVEPLNPFYNLYCATTRKSIKHKTLPAFLPQEAFTLENALKCYTVTPYYFSYEENNKFEDYIVINHELEEKTLLETVVLETYMDGTLVYKKEVL
jgi:predicted amidohydrolase YtcJ